MLPDDEYTVRMPKRRRERAASAKGTSTADDGGACGCEE